MGIFRLTTAGRLQSTEHKEEEHSYQRSTYCNARDSVELAHIGDTKIAKRRYDNSPHCGQNGLLLWRKFDNNIHFVGNTFVTEHSGLQRRVCADPEPHSKQVTLPP
eukprot:TRINITY_DN66599_c0_g1_i15.p5 TRINITY_DN66599_c0_g1~~TRINITY_DN66599_c0_g1_i15.p5  ORF type:complete len:106 (-),score=3.97 TRINITY_DN66599_c0_g1_i15:477-794(-)